MYEVMYPASHKVPKNNRLIFKLKWSVLFIFIFLLFVVVVLGKRHLGAIKLDRRAAFLFDEAFAECHRGDLDVCLGHHANALAGSK